MARPRISGLNTWEKYKRKIFEVMIEALSILQDETHLEEDEPVLNRRLYNCFVQANHRLKLNHHVPTCEGKNPPDPDDEERAARENKIPDFYWHLLDPTVLDSRRCVRRFVLECKRLGKPSSSGWILNENYVQNSIHRFMIEEYGYGKGDGSGAMIGYVQNMEFDAIFCEVNATIDEMNGEPVTTLQPPTGGWKVDGISCLDHTLERSFPQTPFRLWHLWVDLRGCYDRKSVEQETFLQTKDDSTEKRSFPSSRWGKMSENASYLMASSLNLAVLWTKVGRCPY